MARGKNVLVCSVGGNPKVFAHDKKQGLRHSSPPYFVQHERTWNKKKIFLFIFHIGLVSLVFNVIKIVKYHFLFEADDWFSVLMLASAIAWPPYQINIGWYIILRG